MDSNSSGMNAAHDVVDGVNDVFYSSYTLQGGKKLNYVILPPVSCTR